MSQAPIEVIIKAEDLPAKALKHPPFLGAMRFLPDPCPGMTAILREEDRRQKKRAALTRAAARIYRLLVAFTSALAVLSILLLSANLPGSMTWYLGLALIKVASGSLVAVVLIYDALRFRS